ncbi:S-layer homology domain-containing protein, partial [Lysinibacillus sp. S2017]
APKANLTREQAAKMIVEAYGLTGEADLSTFADAKTVEGKWSESYLSTAVATGVIKGQGEKLAATNSITRQEFAVMLTRAMDATTDNAAELLAEVEKAATALDTAVKALNTEVKADEIAAATAEVATAKEAAKTLEAALEAAKEVVTEEQATAAKEAIVAANKAIEATEAVIAKAVEDAKTLAVESVKLLNATQVEVKFVKAVDEDSVIDAAGKVVSGVVNFAELGSASTITEADLTATLSEDGKTLVITTKAGQTFEGRYDITIAKATDKDNKEVTKYEAKTVEFAKDATAPTITGTERVSATQVKVIFSEPVTFTAGAVTADTANVKSAGAAINDLAATGVTEVVVDLSDATIAAGKEVKLTFNGVEDAIGNLINPQPATVTVKKDAVDTVAPTLTAVTQTGAQTFTVTFDKATTLGTTGSEVTVSNATVKTIAKVSDTVYKVTTNENLKGLQKVTVLTGNAANIDAIPTTTDLTKTVTFTTNEDAPTATSKLVTKEGVEYIELTFNKDVYLNGSKEVTIEGSYVENYVTKTLAAVDVVAQYADTKGDDKKVVLLPLTGLAVKGAAYDVTIVNKATTTNGIVSEAGVAIEELAAKFTRGEDTATATTNTEVVTGVAVNAVSGNNDKVEVEFTFNSGFQLDGATATNAANYTINGAEVESATLNTAGTTTQKVTLTLKKNSNTFTGTRNVTVEGVKIAGSTDVMKATTVKSAVIKENVRPTLSSAVVTDGKEITLSFSEAITSTDAAAFDVKIGGGVKTGATAAVVDGKVVITLADVLTNEELAKTITVEPTATSTSTKFVVKDAAGNALEKFEVVKATIAE